MLDVAFDQLGSSQRLVKLPFRGSDLAWFIIDQGRLRRIASSGSLTLYRQQFGLAHPDDVELARSFKRGPIAPSSPEMLFDPGPSATLSAGRMRENVCSIVRGRGLEFGAGGRPMIVPLGCTVTYVDRFSDEEIALYSSSRHGVAAGEFVSIDVVDTLEAMATINEESVDFIIASHVIEHVRNPIQAIINAYCKLRAGGHLILMVPDMRRTHDKRRPVTPLSHLVADYLEPSDVRDLENYIEKYHYVEGVPYTESETFIARWRQRSDIHLHTFTYESFLNLLDFIRNISPFRSTWSNEGILAGGDSKEMYFILTK